MAVTATEVLIDFKHPPRVLFDDVRFAHSNYFRFRVDPNVFISLGARVKKPGEAMTGEEVELIACQRSLDEMKPYERLLGDAIRGDSLLFARYDSVEYAWGVVEEVLKVPPPLHVYEPDTWGPPEADQILGGQHWHNFT
jgi:glucose-6-phosphate 1-dehydrogenase